ncbi:hypothetical protein [Thalassotalea marina]|uniref:FTR1 family iron permease n=1 Tax=Thalassotalea marina TaxID=1673741 RepID=A0A919EHI4_9GAMM|nr:hypothetical protein [Thalassotalea marina]GHF79120.1 hypothetical protein GCM10017161_02840 [Thalassotalea marina]
MLINTVILFVKDVLPVFIMLSFISMFHIPQLMTRRDVILLLLLTLAGMWLLNSHIESLSELFDGGGLELLYTVIDVAVYFALLMSCIIFISAKPINIVQKLILIVSIAGYIAINLSEFFLYFSTFLVSSQTLVSTLVGASFGLGICVSFTALFALTLNSLRRNRPIVLLLVWALYLAGFLAQTLYQLQQIDVLNSGRVLWNSSQWVADSSEYGYLLKAMFGYVSTPTTEYAVVYLLSLILFAAVIVLPRKLSRAKLNPMGGLQ